MFIHDLIKIKYVTEGYLKNYPYHLISDVEMIHAFRVDGGYFDTNYPLLDDSLQDPYNALVDAINYYLDKYLEDGSEIPSWVYSYMLGNTVSVNSSEEDVLELMNLLNISIDAKQDLVFDAYLSSQCYKISKEWVKKVTNITDRPATIFGEPHVFKSLRLQSTADI